MHQLSQAVTVLRECEKHFKKDRVRLKNILKKALEGSLIIHENASGTAKYYWQYYENNTQKRMHLTKTKKLRTIQKLSDKKYAKTALKSIEKALKCIRTFLNSCPNPSSFDFDLADQLAKRHYITTAASNLSTEEYKKQWKASFIDFLSFHDEHKIHVCEDGNVYRSKSEVMIARELRTAGISYVYDARKDLANGDFVYPDFTFLHPITLEEMYWEHFGRMDKPDYANRFMEKRAEFQTAGLIEEKNLFFTYETEKYPLTQEQICKTISKIINTF